MNQMLNQTLDDPGTDLCCPSCGYSLRGLTEMRCPECGRRFEWLDLLVPASKVHPYLFEHHGGKGFREGWLAFWRTAWGGLWPWQFWPPLHPAQPSRPGRMLAYWAAAMAVAFLGVLGPHLAQWAGDVYTRRARWIGWNEVRAFPPSIRSAVGAAPAALDPPDHYFDPSRFWWMARENEPSFLAWWAWGCAWPWITWAALLLLRRLSARSEWMTSFVTPTSLLRCALYSADVLLWVGLTLLAMSALWLLAQMAGTLDHFLQGFPAACAVTVAALGGLRCVHKLAVGLDAYLRVSRPWRWAIASQVLVSAAGVAVVGVGWLVHRWLA